MHFSLTELFDDLPTIHIVDVGASPIDGPLPNQIHDPRLANKNSNTVTRKLSLDGTQEKSG